LLGHRLSFGLGLGLLQELLDLSLQPLECFVHMIVTHGFMLGRIGFDLRAVQKDVTQLDQTGLLTQLQDIDKQGGQGLEVRFSKNLQSYRGPGADPP
jgi:hypothetical protein